MNASAKEDKFSALMTMRVEPLTIEGLPPLEIREQPLNVIKPLLDSAAEISNAEFTNRLLGMSLFLDGEQLTYERVLAMGLSTVRRLMPAIPVIMEVYGLKTEAKALADELSEESASETSTTPADGGGADSKATEAAPTDDDEPTKPKKKD